MPLDKGRPRTQQFVQSMPVQENGEPWQVKLSGAFEVTPWVVTVKWSARQNPAVSFDWAAMSAARARAWGDTSAEVMPRGVELHMGPHGEMFGVDELTEHLTAAQGSVWSP